jgi:hypothetical protein
MYGDSNTLFFADGINSETDGLFGAIDATTPLHSPPPCHCLPPASAG